VEYGKGMHILLRWLINALAIMVAAYLLPGVFVSSLWVALVVAVVLGLLNVFMKPLLILLTLPVTVLSLGLFVFVINAVLVLLVGQIVPGFFVSGFWSALLFSLVLSLLHSFLATWETSSKLA
jgi:putative membrane protein